MSSAVSLGIVERMNERREVALQKFGLHDPILLKPVEGLAAYSQSPAIGFSELTRISRSTSTPVTETGRPS